MKIKLIIVALVALMLTGCGFFENNSETIVFYGKTDWVMDNESIIAPDGYFINFYELKKIDEQLFIYFFKCCFSRLNFSYFFEYFSSIIFIYFCISKFF